MTIKSLTAILAWAALLAGLALPAVAPEISNTAMLVLIGLSIPFCWRSNWRQLVTRPAVAMPMVAVVLLAFAFAFTAKGPWYVGAALALAPLYLVAPLAALFERIDTRDAPTAIGLAALAGVLAAALVAGYDAFILHQPRAGISVANPIHFADVALILGFVALVGTMGNRPWRLVFALGPILSLFTVYLSGSRGPLLAALPMLASVAVIGLFWILPRRWALPALLGVLLAGLAALGLAAQTGWLQSQPIFANLLDVLHSGASEDGSTMQRLAMYKTAYNAFLASPIFGHGLIGFIAATATYAPPGVVFPAYEHLHNDIADFAVIGGMIGLCAYALIIAAPLVASWRATNTPSRRAAILLGAPLSVGYLAMGLTNATFGILTLTVLYSVGLALIAFLLGPRPPLS